MFGPNQGMGRRFVVPTCSNYPLCNKTSERWEETLENTLLTPSNILLLRYGRIYCLLLGPPIKRKQYEVMINDYFACSCINFSSMMSMSFSKQGLWVQCKHLYYILQYVMYFGIK
jgi:hypothetical protein